MCIRDRIDYINTQRVNRAAQLLVQNNHTIAAVAEEVGILDVNYFTKIFKKTLGVTPTPVSYTHLCGRGRADDPRA